MVFQFVIDGLAGAVTQRVSQLSHEQAMDYVIAGLIALLFPLMRLILDRTLYDVRFQ